MEEKERMTFPEAVLSISEAISPSKITLRLEEGSEGLSRNGMIILALKKKLKRRQPKRKRSLLNFKKEVKIWLRYERPNGRSSSKCRKAFIF